MPVIAHYDFNDADHIANDSATDNGNQFGYYLNGAQASGGEAVLDGDNDLVKIFPNPVFQMDRGTLEIRFNLSDAPLTETQTVLSRDSVGETAGGYHIDILADGSVVVSHESTGGTTTFTTGPGFANPGDHIELSYSWDHGGNGGALSIDNTTTNAGFSANVPNDLTMDMGGIDQPWVVGAGQATSDPDMLNNIDQHFSGSVDMLEFSDTSDNCHERDGIIWGTPTNDVIDVGYTGDNDGDMVDANDAIIPGDGPNDDRIIALDGDDTVIAGEGNDSVHGGDGNDDIDTGEGNDLVDGGDGNDRIDTTGGLPNPDIGYPGLYPADSDPTDDLDTVFGGSGDDTILTGDDADLITGGYGDDHIDGGVDADTIFGNIGDDTIIGAEGSDSIEGGYGDDLVYGGYGPNVPDVVNIRDDQGDLAPDNGRDFINGGIGNDTLFGMDDDDTIFGGQDNDLIDAGIDDDEVSGGSGNDTITGGQGADSLSGNADRDLFLVGGPEDGIGDVINGNENGDDYDTLDLRGSGPFHITYDPNNAENGRVDYLDSNNTVIGTLTFTNIENVIPCFTPGTLIATPKGEVPVELLKAGDKVVTRDNGIQEIGWVGQKALGWHDLLANPHLKPVMIRQGSLGNGLPERDMLVSPNHRMLVANDRTALYFDEHEVLVSAKHLVAAKGIDTVDAVGTTYIHFMFDRHEVVLANGAWTESFQPGDYTLQGMGNAQRNEIFDLFPDLKTEAGRQGYTAARRTLKRHEALLIAR